MGSLGEALGRVEAGANAEWKRAALEAVYRAAQTHRTFNTDTVWLDLFKAGYATHEHRAMGPIIIAARKNGWIELLTCDHCGTENVINASIREESHAHPLATYKSLL